VFPREAAAAKQIRKHLINQLVRKLIGQLVINKYRGVRNCE
jgi:hypothetical protein